MTPYGPAVALIALIACAAPTPAAAYSRSARHPGSTHRGRSSHKRSKKSAASETKKIVSGHLREANACYEDAGDAAGKPSKVTVSWTITETGRTTDIAAVHAHGKPGSPELEGCLIDLISGWTFSPGKNDRSARYTFRFGKPPPRKSHRRHH